MVAAHDTGDRAFEDMHGAGRRRRNDRAVLGKSRAEDEEESSCACRSSKVLDGAAMFNQGES